MRSRSIQSATAMAWGSSRPQRRQLTYSTLGKAWFDCTDGTLGPEATRGVGHRSPENFLNHPVNAKSLPFPIDANQREAAQSLEHIVDHERVALGTGKCRFEGRPELGHPAGQ